MKFKDIKQFPFASYQVDISWDYLEDSLVHYNKEDRLDFDPEFQRGYVWTKEQQIAYVEYQLRGGFSGKDVFFNHPNWMTTYEGKMVLVDGKQRLTAVLAFLRNEIPAFGFYYRDFEDKIGFAHVNFKFHINNLKTEKEVVEWYLGFNTGGSIHTEEDLKPAKELLKRLNKTNE
jgi:hypothetical protein